jgi:hypothetical protein
MDKYPTLILLSTPNKEVVELPNGILRSLEQA